MTTIRGNVLGNRCPKCRAEIEMEGEFHEGDEIECECGAVLVLDEVEAEYTVYFTAIGHIGTPSAVSVTPTLATGEGEE